MFSAIGGSEEMIPKCPSVFESLEILVQKLLIVKKIMLGHQYIIKQALKTQDY